MSWGRVRLVGVGFLPGWLLRVDLPPKCSKGRPGRSTFITHREGGPGAVSVGSFGDRAEDGTWFHTSMRWQPQEERCAECEFSWTIEPEESIALVDGSPPRLASLIVGAERATDRPAEGVWSPSEYLWHLVDVLRIGRERLLTIATDPTAGIPCWDENALAEVRNYGALSPAVGLIAYEGVVGEWVVTARTVPAGASVEHAQDGTMTAGDIMRRNAHEVAHHELDIQRGLRSKPV